MSAEQVFKPEIITKEVEQSSFTLKFENYQNYKRNEEIKTKSIRLNTFDASWLMKIASVEYHQDWGSYRLVTIELNTDKDDIWKSENFFCCAKVECKNGELEKSCSTKITKDMSVATIVLFLSDKDLLPCLVSGILELKFTLFIMFEGSISHASDFFAPLNARKKIISKIADLKSDPKFADFTFIVQGKKFPVHKVILAAASPVFFKIFTSDMEEAKKNECNLSQFKPEIFEHLLDFIYTGNLPQNLDSIAMSVCEAADYFQIDELKEVAAQKMLATVTVENSLEFFRWASLYNIKPLLQKSWEILKFDVLKIFFPLVQEPPEVATVEEIMALQQKNSDISKKIYAFSKK